MSIKKLIAEMAMNTLEERVEIDHSRYMRSHGKKARGNGMWMFTSKDMGKPNSDEMVTVSGDMSTAAKEAAKKLGVNRIYVMEEVEQIDEISDRTKTSYLAKAKADQKAAQKRYTKAAYRDGGASFFDADTPEMEKDAKRIAKRRKGIAMAKEEVELDEKLASNIIRGDTYIGVPDRIVAQAKDKVNKMRPSTASEHSKAMQKALSDMGWEMTISGKYVREETDLSEDVHNDLNDAIIDFQKKLMRMTSQLDPVIAKEVKKLDKDLDALRTGPLFKIRPGR
jgi:hypothetical protein